MRTREYTGPKIRLHEMATFGYKSLHYLGKDPHLVVCASAEIPCLPRISPGRALRSPSLLPSFPFSSLGRLSSLQSLRLGCFLDSVAFSHEFLAFSPLISLVSSSFSFLIFSSHQSVFASRFLPVPPFLLSASTLAQQSSQKASASQKLSRS